MERMTSVEDWKKNNINGQVAVKLIEIGKKKGEKVYMSNDFQRSLIYQGREMNLGLKVVGSKVGDIPDESDYIYTAYLGDLAACSDFYEAVSELQKEKGFSLEISDTINLEDCTLSLGGEYERTNETLKTIRNMGLRNREVRDEILGGIRKELSNRLAHYDVITEYGMLYLRATNTTAKRGIIEKDKDFIDDMNRIKNYFDSELPEIETKIEKAKEEERRKEEETRENQAKRANDLQNQL